MESNMVIKVKYGDTLRRFNARVNENEQLDLDMDGLKAKIHSLFNFPPDAELTLTYVDEDGDVVALVDDDDLRDAMMQRLKFLRIDVQLNSEKFSKSYARSSGSATPLRSPGVQTPLPNIGSGISEVLKTVPEPLREVISKLSQDLASKAAASNPGVAEIIDLVSRMSQTPVSPAGQSQVGAGSGTQAAPSEFPTAPSVPTGQSAIEVDLGQGDLYKSKPPSGAEVATENVTRDVAAPFEPVPTPVDLNVDPPCDSNPSGCTPVDCAPTAPTAKGKEGKAMCAVPVGISSGYMDPMRAWGNQCPFSGMPIANESAVPPLPPRVNPFKRSHGRHDAMVFHRGVQCDGCGVHPITGPRYKSKVKDDYDLCSICFAEMGNEADYIKMDRPVSYRHSRLFRGPQDHLPPYCFGAPPLSHVMRNCGMKPSRAKLDNRFIADVNVLDGTVMAPSTPFTKIWRMRNSGTVAWPQGSRLVWIGGDKFSHADSFEIEIPADGLPVDAELDIAVDFTSPKLPGRYISYWRMASPSGTRFGQRVWVLIQVDSSIQDSICDGLKGLNLNLPPDWGSASKAPEIDMNVQPVADVGFLEPTKSASVSQSVTTMVDEQSKNDQEVDFPINDALLVGHDGSASAPPQVPSSVMYPMIDLCDLVPSGSCQAPPAATAPTSSNVVDANDTVEKTLLKELEEMGFKQVDLNKEILRKNEYDLEQSVDDLCGVAEWDPILVELQEMGFRDKDMNKKLLEKNNGSIKRVVMDLLAGEKA